MSTIPPRKFKKEEEEEREKEKEEEEEIQVGWKSPKEGRKEEKMRTTGLEPVLSAWKAEDLPLIDIRSSFKEVQENLIPFSKEGEVLEMHEL